MKNNLVKYKSDRSDGLFDRVGAFVLYQGDQIHRLLLGVQPRREIEAVFDELPQDRATAKIHGGEIVVRIPLREDYSALWLFEKNINPAQLPELIPELRVISQLIQNNIGTAEDNSAHPPSEQDGFEHSLLQALESVHKVPRSKRLRYVLSVLCEKFDVPHMAMIAFVGNRIQRFAVTNETVRGAFSNALPAIREHLKNRDSNESYVVHSDDQNAQHFEAISHMLQIDKPTLIFPKGRDGVGLICDEEQFFSGQAEEILRIANLVAMPRPSFYDWLVSTKNIWSKILLAAVLILMLWPGKLTVQGVILTTPASSEVVSLGPQAQLEAVYFGAGDWVEEGEVLASFELVALEDQRVQLQLESALESLNAQDYLGQNQYGQVVLAEHRQKIVAEQIEAIEKEIDDLELKAKTTGRLIYMIEGGTTGQVLPSGTRVGEILPENRFNIKMILSEKDAYLIKEGQRGRAYFRGITEETFDFEVISPVLAQPEEAQSAPRLELVGSITTPDQKNLIIGLSGYGKVEIARRPNILIWLRLPLEYLRITAWKYLNLRF